MDETMTGNILAVLYILQVPLLIGLCICNAKTVKKKGRAAAPFIWLTIGLGGATVIGFTLFWVLLHWPLEGEAEGVITILLAYTGDAASVLIAKRALNADGKRESVLAHSLRPQHFTKGREFSRSDFDGWVLESQKAAQKALTAYLCSVAGGLLLSVLFSLGIGGVFGNVLALFSVFGGVLLGGSLAKKAAGAAAHFANRLGISNAEISVARALLKQGKTAWNESDPSEN